MPSEPALHYWKRSNTYWLFCAIPVEIKLPLSSVWVQESKWQYLLRPHLNAPWLHRLLRKIGFREHLIDFRRHSLSSPTSLSLHKRFRRQLHPDLHRQLRPEMLDDIQAHYSTLYQLGSNTGASFQAMHDLLSAAFPPTQLYYFLRLSVFVNEPFRSKAQKLLHQVMRKRQLQLPSTMTQPLSLVRVILRLMDICSGRNVALLWDHLRHPHSAIWLQWRTSSGTKPCALFVFTCPTSG